MAKYHFEFGFVGRGPKHESKSSIAKAAYNSREKLEDERTGKTYSWSRLGDAEWTAIFLPEHAPQEWHDLNAQDKLRNKLWQELENREDKNRNRDTAMLSRAWILAIPNEFDTKEKRVFFAKDFARSLAREGWIIDIAIHPPETDKRNYHIHAQLPLREVDQDGFSKRINLWGKEAGINRDMTYAEEMAKQKERFVNLGARHLKRWGHELEAERFKVAHLTLDKQKADAERRKDWSWAKELDREPTIHYGPKAWGMKKKGIRTRVEDLNEQIKERNYVRQAAPEYARDGSVGRPQRHRPAPFPSRITRTAERAAGKVLEFAAAVGGLLPEAKILTPEQKRDGQIASQEKREYARAEDWKRKRDAGDEQQRKGVDREEEEQRRRGYDRDR
jgi:hypothetical protein